MKIKLRFLGHPPHPILIHVPLGILSIALVFDIVGTWRGTAFWWSAAFWIIVVGLIAAIPTVATGLTDLAAFVQGGRPDRIAAFHMIFMLSALSIFVLSLVFREGPESNDPTARYWAIGLDLAGSVLLAVGGWFGGELVYGHATGVRKTSLLEE